MFLYSLLQTPTCSCPPQKKKRKARLLVNDIQSKILMKIPRSGQENKGPAVWGRSQIRSIFRIDSTEVKFYSAVKEILYKDNIAKLSVLAILLLLFCCLITKLQPARFLWPWDFPGKNTEVGCYFFLQGIIQTQGLNLGLLLCRQTFLPFQIYKQYKFST